MSFYLLSLSRDYHIKPTNICLLWLKSKEIISLIFEFLDYQWESFMYMQARVHGEPVHKVSFTPNYYKQGAFSHSFDFDNKKNNKKYHMALITK